MATLTRFRAAYALAALLLLLAAGTGCVNPFTPAKPEQPTSAPVVPNFNTYEGVLTTLERAIENKGASGRVAYYDALPDSTTGPVPSFYAVHDPAVVDGWRITAQRDPPDPWDTKLERSFYDYLISRLPQFIYDFEWRADNSRPIEPVDDVAGTALLHRHYLLTVVDRPPPNTSLQDTLAVGYADLYLRKLNGRWYLVRWEDRYDPDVGVNPANPNWRTMGWRRLDSSTGL